MFVAELRIALWTALNLCPDALSLVGPDCSSWGIPARSTSMRSAVNPFGRLGLDWVWGNYCLVSRNLICIATSQYTSKLFAHYPRLVLLLLVMLAKHATWIIEQPHGSLLPKHARWDWLVNQVCKAPGLNLGGVVVARLQFSFS